MIEVPISLLGRESINLKQWALERDAKNTLFIGDVARVANLFRGLFDDESEAALKQWIKLAQEGATPELGDEQADVAFAAFRGWLNEWREVARVTITQRGQLIALGLAARRQTEDEEVVEVPAVEAAPVSVH